MKIWIQSGSALAKDAKTVYGSEYEQSLNRHFQEVARPGTTVDVFGIEGTPVGKDRYYASQHVVVSLMIKSVLRAEQEGYDVIAVVNTLDHGFYEISEVVDIPVVFITQSALHLAGLLAPKMAFLTHNQAMLLHVSELVKRYGFAERMVPGGCLNLTYDDFPKMYKEPEAYISMFAEAARRIIKRGANILLVAGNPANMFLVDQGVKDIDDVPILDVCAAVIKVAELMVDLREMGISRSKQGQFATPSPQEIAQIRKLYE
jgi:allantoin racemase